MLKVENLSVRLRGRPVLKDVSLEVEKGQVVGLLGPNGAGKTTCFRTILGHVTATSGSIVLEDRDISDTPIHQRARLGIAYLPQEPSVFRGLTVEKNILAVLELRKGLHRRGRAEELDRLLDELQIGGLRHAQAAMLSGGERRRVEIARALALAPQYVLFDEPFAGVDPVSVGEIRRLVTQLVGGEIGVLVTDHNVRETLRVCHHAYILSEGRVLAEGTPAEIVRDPLVRSVYLGDEFEL